MIYWQGIGDWCFYEEIANIKSTILFQSEHAQWQVWHKIANIKSANFFPQANPPNITPANKNHLVWYMINATAPHYTGLRLYNKVIYR